MTLRIRDLAAIPTAAFHDCDALPDTRIERVITDSREARKGDLFVAFRGARADAHDFVADVMARGALACMVERKWWKKHRTELAGLALIVVAETESAYGVIARLHRAGFDVPVVGITGSNGKTGTKEMIAAVLGTRFNVLHTEGNLNNHIGLPATLLRLTADHQVVVTEMGTNQPGDIAWLCGIAQPTHGVITNIGRAHIEKLKSREGIAVEKCTLFAALPAKGVAIVNMDEPLLKGTVPRRASRIGFGISSRADVRLVSVELDTNGLPVARIEARRFSARPIVLRLKSPGRHSAMNAAAALATGFAFGCSTTAMKKALESITPIERRLQAVRAGGVLVFNDSYNANPDSVLAALDLLRDLRIKGQRCVVLGDMLELGSSAKIEHERIGEAVVEAGIPFLFTIGRHARSIASAARAKAQERSFSLLAVHFTEKIALAEALEALLTDGDAVLIKGSRGMHMEDTVEEVLRRFTDKGGQA